MVNKIIFPLLTGIVCGLPSAFSKEVKKPNVIVIIVDDLGSKMKVKWEQWFSQLPEGKTER